MNQEQTTTTFENETIESTREAFFAHLKSTGAKAATLYTYGKDYDVITKFFKGEKRIEKILPLQVANFLRSNAFLKKPNGDERATRTKDKTARLFRKLLTWCEETGRIAKAPIPKTARMGARSRQERKVPANAAA